MGETDEKEATPTSVHAEGPRLEKELKETVQEGIDVGAMMNLREREKNIRKGREGEGKEKGGGREARKKVVRRIRGEDLKRSVDPSLKYKFREKTTV